MENEPQVNDPLVPNNDPPQLSATEQEARASGWVPKEEYQGEENKWVDADEFVRRGPLFKKIDLQNRELKELKRDFAVLAQHHAKVKETEYKRALETLKAQKKEAFEAGDPDRIIAIDDKIDFVKDQQKQFNAEQASKIQEQVQEVHPELEAWVNRNSWYTSNKAMKAFADTLGTELAGTMSPSQALKEIEKQVKLEFPHKFENPNRSKPSAVENTSSKGSSKSSSYTPTDVERRFAEKFVKAGAFKNVEEYYKELQPKEKS